MYISKNELIKRLVRITGKNKKEFMEKSITDLSPLYKRYIANEKRTYLNVSYKDKDIAKLLGAMYDGAEKKWYIPPGVNEELFKEWM